MDNLQDILSKMPDDKKYKIMEYIRIIKDKVAKNPQITNVFDASEADLCRIRTKIAETGVELTLKELKDLIYILHMVINYEND